MSASGIPIWFLLLLECVCLALAALAVVLLIVGYRGRRIGDEPRCRNCEYQLSGISSAQCPECGTALTSGAIVKGQLRRRPRQIAIGGAMILLCITAGSVVLSPAARQINWYQHKPAFLVMRDFRNPAMQSQALTEMMRRDAISPINAAYRDEIVEAALIAQGAAVPPPLTRTLLDFTSSQFSANRLSEAQKKKLFEQCLRLELKLRPVVAAGDPVPFLLIDHARTPWGWQVEEQIDGCDVDDRQNVYRGGGKNGFSGIGSGGSTGSSLRAQPVGEHTFTAHVKVTILGQASAGRQPLAPLYSEDRTLKATFRVEPAGAVPPVKLIHDPALADRVRQSLAPTDFSWNRFGSRHMEGMMVITSPPTPVAFDVFAAFNGGEYRLGSFTAVAGAAGNMHSHISAAETLNDPPPGKVDLILRPSVSSALRTVDLTEIWGEQIIFKGVTVSVPPASQSKTNPEPLTEE